MTERSGGSGLGALRVLPAIVGPTGAGKSALAMALAREVGAAIVSADSRQVYRGFDVGTAKPTPAERAEVPHHGLDVAEPTERWSAARWADDCVGWVAACDAAGTPPLLVGGTGLYLRVLSGAFWREPPLAPDRRAALGGFLEALPPAELHRWALALDPARASLGRTQLLRAVEVALLTGERLSRWHQRDAEPPRFALRYLVVDPGPVLGARIERRVDAMLGAGWLDEVRVLALRVPADAPAWNASGYATWRDHLRGELPFAAARARVVTVTRQYAKRQRTWFRHQLAGASVLRLNPDAPDALGAARAWWRGADVPALDPHPYAPAREDAA